MATLEIINIAGEKGGTLEIKDEIFNIEPNRGVVHEVLTAELAAARAGNACTKTRAMVRGGGRKPFKQKGTGRARQGSIRAPHMKGGGVTFGPRPKSFEKKVNKKVRKLALKSVLSDKFSKNLIYVLDNTLSDIKTKNILKFFDTTKINKPLFLIDDFIKDSDWNLYLSSRNIKDVIVLDKTEISIFWLLKQHELVITKDALAKLEEALS